MKITPMWNVLPTLPQNFPPAKITMLTVLVTTRQPVGRPWLLCDSVVKWSSGKMKNTYKQANWENCGPLLHNKFDLEEGQRSRNITIRKVLSQRTHIPSIKAPPVIVQKLWPSLKFLWQTDRQMDEWDLMSLRFHESWEQLRHDT